ncbi:MAG: hypothetical protein HY062_12840 [Bacteroidetes bacterium]|nr:hypothetical protein [Bacteroidota bacterium]
MQTTQTPPVNSNFIRSMIRIANPEWTAEQIDAEVQRKLAEMANPESDDHCEFCSS